MVQPLEDKKKKEEKSITLFLLLFLTFIKEALKRALKGTVFNGQTLIDEC